MGVGLPVRQMAEGRDRGRRGGEGGRSSYLRWAKELGADLAKTNPNGGAVALGHPLGCTGAKLTVQVLNELKRQQKKYGMVTMCVGTGMGAAGIFERC